MSEKKHKYRILPSRSPRAAPAPPSAQLETAPDRTHFPRSRREMISEAAYYKALGRGFEGGCTEQDWLDAEAEIEQQLARDKPGDV